MNITQKSDFLVFHKRFLMTSRMRRSFEECLEEVRGGSRELDDVDLQTYLLYWYCSLHILVEGWTQLKYEDEPINQLIKSSNKKLLKSARDKTFHYNRHYYPKEVREFLENQGSAAWARHLHDEFSRFCLSKIKEIKQK